jgi:enoyl-CoA hydratase/carnithine racemase
VARVIDNAVRLERPPGDIVWIRIERPKTRNAMSREMWQRLRELVTDVRRDASVRALVLCGMPAAFVSGADIADFAALPTVDGESYEADVEATLAAIEGLDIATIAAVSGGCTGGGAVLACACDLRIGTADARVGVPIARTVGNVTTARNVSRLAAVVGMPRAMAWILTAQLSDALAAERCGFFLEVVPDFEALLERAETLGRTIASNAPLTIAAAKELARRLARAAATVDDRDLLERCYGSADFREGVAAFVGKRAARFQGR